MRAVLWGVALLGVTALLLPGCPGELEDPERFTAVCDPPSQLFIKTCGSSACHDARDPEAGLDLVSPGVASRLIDRPASCADTNPEDPEACVCVGRLLVDSAYPAQSYLLEKVSHDAPECDERMPVAGKLREGEMECVRRWIEQITGHDTAL